MYPDRDFDLQRPLPWNAGALTQDLALDTLLHAMALEDPFLRSVGLAQLMMQCGLFVPAESFRSGLCDGVFTHYRREEDETMKSGKLDEELGRMSEIVDHLMTRPMVLFNESFAATNEREGWEIARQIVFALMGKRIRVFYVTHLFEFRATPMNGTWSRPCSCARRDGRTGGGRSGSSKAGLCIRASGKTGIAGLPGRMPEAASAAVRAGVWD
jgi:hypothetical protein